MSCDEKKRLTHEYESATQQFAEAVQNLHRNTGTSSKPDYERLQLLSNGARVKSEQARLELERHLAEHKC